MSASPLLSSLGSYFTPEDGFRHAIVSTPSGQVSEIAFNQKDQGVGISTLGFFCGIQFLTAFYTADDKLQHPVVATATGDIFFITYKAGSYQVSGSLARFLNMFALAGFYAGDDHKRILIVGTSDGAIHEVYFDSNFQVAITEPALATLPGLTHLAAFYSDDDQNRHVIAATANGDITEIWYSSKTGVHITAPPLANFKNIVSIAAFYAADLKMRTVIVATADGAIHEVYYNSNVGVHITEPALATFPGITGISGFYTSDDQNRHVIVTDTGGKVTEVFYNSKIGVHVTNPPLAHFGIPAPTAEYAGPDVSTLDKESAPASAIASSSPSGRCIAIAGSLSRLYAYSDTGGIWWSAQGGPWTLGTGSPAPSMKVGATVSVLAVSPTDSNRVLASNESGLWETTNAGVSWAIALNPVSIGAGSTTVTSVAFDDSGRAFIGVSGGVAIQQAAGAAFHLVNLSDDITAVAISDSKVWARSATALYVSPSPGAAWSAAIPIPTTIPFSSKVKEALAATDNFAFLLTELPGSNPSNPNGCASNNVLVIFNAATKGWSTQTVTSADKVAWQQSKGLNPTDGDTCQGTGGVTLVNGVEFVSRNGRQFVKCVRLRDTTLTNVIGERIQLLFGAGQEVWRARSQNSDGTITDWNWLVGTVGAGFTDRDPVHADIWDFHMDPTAGGRTAWTAGDGGVNSVTVAAADYNFSGVAWKLAMQGLTVHQIQSLTVLRVNQVSRPRIAYVIGDNGCYSQDSSAYPQSEALWHSYDSLGDGNFSAGDSSAPSFAWVARNLTSEGFLRYSSAPQPIRLINPKPGTFVDPSIPTRFRFIPSPWQAGQFTSADVVMMVDLPLISLAGAAFPTQPGASSKGNPVLIRNKTFDVNPDINEATAQGQGWILERGTLPANCQGFAVTGNRTQPIYFAFDSSTLFAEQNGAWTAILKNLLSSQTFGPVFPNPYDSSVVFALTSDKGIQVMTAGGGTFGPDASLNALVSAADVNQIAFCYDNPAMVVVCTESGKVLLNRGDGSAWSDLGGVLPTVPIPIRSVAIECDGIYVGTFGRGLWRIVNY